MKKISVFLVSCVVFCVFGAVNIDHKQIKKANREHNSYRILNSAPVKYAVDYNITDRKGKKTVGDPSSSSTGIGLNNGWYSSGTLRLYLDGKPQMKPADIRCEQDTLTFTWPGAVLKMVFPEGSTQIFCHVTAPGVKRVKLGFLGMPGFVAKRKTPQKSYVSTQKVNHFLNDGKYVPAGESWFMLYDGEFNKRGIPVVILDPAEVKSGMVTGSAGSLLISASFEMKKNDCRFVLMGIPTSHMDAEVLYEDLKANGEKYLRELRNFQFK